MPIEILSTFHAGDTAVRYLRDTNSQVVGLQLVPVNMLDDVPEWRAALDIPDMNADGAVWPPRQVSPLVQLHLREFPIIDGISLGTLHDMPSAKSLRYESQNVEEDDHGLTIETILKSEWGFSCRHTVSWLAGEQALTIEIVFINDSATPLTLELLSSFTLDGITPFDFADAPNRLVFHRFRSGWSAEGRLESLPLEQLNMEGSWAGFDPRIERFGQLGTKPTKFWFPTAALEDTEAGVMWGAQLYWAGSWLMELCRLGDGVRLSGGLADRTFGHWFKVIQPGQSFAAPKAVVACVQGDLDDLAYRLTHIQHRAVDNAPAVEDDLPIVFNDWPANWGRPAHDQIMSIIKRLQGTGTRYYVIDAGWYGEKEWQQTAGDWTPSQEHFPQGLEFTAQAIRDHGLIPGIWFEHEVVGPKSEAYKLTEHHVKLDGVTFTAGDRHLWDMTDPFVIEYLTKRVIGLMHRCGFGYTKIDYNSSMSFGVDGAESPGEGLRQQVEGIYDFFKLMRERLPDLVIENCSSGGQRLEPSLLALSSMGSFSDAFETIDIPILAANMHRLYLPRQNQIWAVIRKTDSAQRIIYTMAATFLGRMGFSGDIPELSDEQWQWVLDAQKLYRRVWPVIKYGLSRRYGTPLNNYLHAEGWQGVLRVAKDDESALAVVHRFKGGSGAPASMPLPNGTWQVDATYALPGDTAEVQDGALVVSMQQALSGFVVYLKKS